MFDLLPYLVGGGALVALLVAKGYIKLPKSVSDAIPVAEKDAAQVEKDAVQTVTDLDAAIVAMAKPLIALIEQQAKEQAAKAAMEEMVTKIKGSLFPTQPGSAGTPEKPVETK